MEEKRHRRYRNHEERHRHMGFWVWSDGGKASKGTTVASEGKTEEVQQQ